MTIRKDKVLRMIDKGLEWSVYLMIFCLPFSKSIIEICVSAGIALFILKRILTGNFRLPVTRANLPLLLIFLTAAVSLCNSQYMALSLRALVSKNLKFIAIYFIVIEAINDRVKLSNLLKIAALSASIIALDTLAQYFITHVDALHNYPTFKYRNEFHYERGELGYLEYFIGYPTGPFPYPNDLSAWLLIIMTPAIFMSLLDLKGKRSRIPFLVLSAVLLYIFILAKARAAWAGFILSAVLIMSLASRKAALLLLACTVIIITVYFFILPDNIFGLSSMRDRGEMWTIGTKIFKDHPVIGNGINTFFNRYMELRSDQYKGKKGSYAHNCYLQMAADTGVLGLGAFLWFILALLAETRRAVRLIKDRFYKPLILGIAAGIFGFLIHSFFDTNLYSLNLASLFWISAGTLISVIRIAGVRQR